MKYTVGGLRKDGGMDVSVEFESDNPEITAWWADAVPLPTSEYMEFVVLCWEE